MTRCKFCKAVPWFDLPEFPTWLFRHLPAPAEKLTVYGQRHDENERNLALGVVHHKSLVSLRTAASSCEMCRLIESGVTNTLSAFEQLLSSEDGPYLRPLGQPSCELWVCRRQKDQDGFLVLTSTTQSDDVLLMTAAGYCVDDDSPLASYFLGRPVNPNPTEQNTLKRLRKWLQECDEQHEHSRPRINVLPSRVLDVEAEGQDANQTKLRESSGLAGNYATLSHCWGSSNPFLTTKTTLEGRKSGVIVSDLPKAFQDAVFMARELGLRYLWIDSLCICQDDRKEWEVETSRMAKIYAGASVTIAATRSADDAAGFLLSRHKRTHVPLSHSINGVEGTVLTFAIPVHIAASTHEYVLLSQEPLTTRAWALQERYLSRRTLHFGTSQISFECQSQFLTEDGYKHYERLNYLGDDTTQTKQRPQRGLAYRGSPSWHQIVRQYSQRRLTIASDKLPALAGLADVFAQRKAGGHSEAGLYFAGLWRDNLIEDLLWQSVGANCKRPVGYRAPSWSWASLDGEIGGTHLSGHTDIAEVEDVYVGTQSGNPFGEVSGGWLRISGPLLPLRRAVREPQDEARSPYVDICSVAGTDYPLVYFTPDVSEEGTPEKLKGKTLQVLIMTYQDKGKEVAAAYRKSLIGLVVQPCEKGTEDEPNAGKFQRMGLLFVSDGQTIDAIIAYNDAGNLATITIV